MAKKNEKRNDDEFLWSDELSKIYPCAPDMAFTLRKKLSGIRTYDELEKCLFEYGRDFNKLYAKYTRYMEKGQRNDASVARKQLEQMDVDFVNNMMAIDGGYELIAVAEKEGLEVDWNKVPITAITSKDYINFLAKKGYDFDAKHIINGVETDFTDYNLANLYFSERDASKSYAELIAKRKEFDKYEAGLRKLALEYSSPDVKPERKEELLQFFNNVAPEYSKKEAEMRGLCKALWDNMDWYYQHAACLEAVAIDHQYVSPQNIKRINPEKLREGIRYMNGRKQVCEENMKKFAPKESADSHTMSEENNGLALAHSLTKSNGVSSLLASAESHEAVYAKEAEAEKSGMSMTERLAQQTQGSTLENAENAMAFVGKDSQTNA